jgi:hypothetical protein
VMGKGGGEGRGMFFDFIFGVSWYGVYQCMCVRVKETTICFCFEACLPPCLFVRLKCQRSCGLHVGIWTRTHTHTQEVITYIYMCVCVRVRLGEERGEVAR